jgi:Kef-type K+ transport system membrane component KefB
MRKYWIYFIGIVLFGFLYENLKAHTSEHIFLLGAILYVLALRLLAERLGK